MHVDIKTIQEQPALIIRAPQVKPQDIGPTLRRLHPRVRRFLDSHGIKPAGAPFANYTRMHPDGSMDIEAGFPVPAGTAGEGEIVTGRLAGGTAAVAIHVGPYRTLTGTWDALKQWLAASGHARGRDACEVYIDIEQEGKVKDDELRTMVYILLEG
jgi:effector-binding domain-containing protein